MSESLEAEPAAKAKPKFTAAPDAVPSAVGAQNLIAAFTAAADGASAVGAEVAQFVEKAVQAQTAAAAQFAQVRSPQEYLELQSKFYRTAMSSYTDHVSSVSGLVAGSFQKTTKPLSDQFAAVTAKFGKTL